MKNQIRYVQLSAGNEELCKTFESLMIDYIAEMNEHDDHPLSEQFQQKWIKSIIAMQGPSDRHLELCYDGGELIGFLYGKIDHKDHKGFIKLGYGYIMEFFVRPEYRRKGYGTMMFCHLENLFQTDGAKRMYLTADPVTGKAFWEAMRFKNTMERSPENQLDIYERAVVPSISVREANTEIDVAAFWEQLHAYHKRDIFPDPDSEDLEYFLGSEYHDHMMKIHGRPQDRCYFLFFHRAGQDIGFAMPVIFNSEDGKCFIMEFCVYPDFRSKGTGKECAKVLLDWARENGALYEELNYGSNERRRRFWESVGFVENGADEWGEPLMILPPTEDVPITVGVLADPEDWQLKKLENGFLNEIGEQALTEEQQEQLQQAIQDGKITFFMAKRGYRAVGMCSVAKCFSTFSCADTGVFDDFYIEPVFRKKGIARKLAQAAQLWCKENNLASLTVCCAPCDEQMYQSLGFDVHLGNTYAYLNN